ncbi:Eco57I restriction-modification methylase domain-containing protein [Sporosarcina ureae]|uniref:Eco57I restriction-modification methylase domain-containing protein n=1 Tax=Sporosarcina ureae TaxID=1571 RepID=UPI0028AD2A8F|nr:Eco57I restriction-modification methylase domain-containing protein [Sporosarcina ureae]
MDNSFKNAFEYKVIYIFTIEDDAHKELVKVGDATLYTDTQIDLLTPNSHELNQAALKRIKSYTNTAGFTPHLLHTEVAVRTIREKDGTVKLKAFRDYNVHAVMKNSGINNVAIGESTGLEWFKVDLETVEKAINAVKQNFSNLSNSDVVKHTPIIFRPEQVEAITKTVKHFKNADRMLWNAKMRFGKTVCALEVVRKCKFEKTIIITHRPVVNAGWYEDFTKIFYGEMNYIYGSTRNGYDVKQLLQSDKKFVYFASVQDLRESSEIGGRFDKNSEVFETKWDCVIVDEAHEGTTTPLGESTIKAVVKEGCGTKFLALSGTPFNIMTEFDEKSIYTWDYIMEQESKYEWNELHFGDSNPYDELPELKIYTYSLGEILASKDFVAFEDKAFNFYEFFRTWTGDFSRDHADMPVTAQEGDFVHEADIWGFLNLMTKEDKKSSYPYANEEYRRLFKHSLWMVPGVKEARALKKLMLKHPIFGNGIFNIVNVAGSGEEEERPEEALSKVHRAIKEAGEHNYTITLSCGRLTTGVTVKEWTAVFMLAGSYSTSAANYLQTIFRVQSPCNENGKIKETAYVFDFAPDRTLKMVANAVSVSAKAGKTKISDKQIMDKFLNYCPVISVSGSEMKEYSTNKLLQQLKKAYADKVVRNGFDDINLYNDELFKLQDVDIKKFDELKGIIGKSKAAPKQGNITVNDQGLTNEEYEETEKLKKKPKKDLSPEEKARLEELKKMKNLRNDAISILRGISIRMPLLIYGADIPYDEEITLDQFVDVVDDPSWNEFMPDGVTKEKFREFQKYYDEEVFIAAGRRIRNIAKEADTLEPTERVKKIAGLFSYFKNPDKETVLTPWRVVNKHMSDCLGGWDFWDEDYNKTLDEPRFVNRGQVTKDVLDKEDCQVLEINSKTGLYPLYITYSAYRKKCSKFTDDELTFKKKKNIWMETVLKNVFIVCKTPMAKAITKRTLIGYYDGKINAHYFDDLISIITNKPKLFTNKIIEGSYWKKGNDMKFDAVIGNPPYQLTDGGGKGYSAKPIYHLFIEQAKELNPRYISMITPSRWFAGGKGLDNFRNSMLNDSRICKIIDYVDNDVLFKGVSIVGGVNYFLWDREYSGECSITSIRGDDVTTLMRGLSEYDILIRNNNAIQLIRRIEKSDDAKMDSVVYPRNVFGISSDYRGNKKTDNEHRVALFSSQKSNSMGITYIHENQVSKGQDLIPKYKVIIGKVVPRGGEVGVDPRIGYRVTSTIQVLYPGSVFTDSYLLLSAFDTEVEAINFAKYMTLRFPRFLLHETYSSMNISKNNFRFVPYLDYTITWTDKELYERFNCTDEEINMIESMIRPMEYVVHKLD